MSLCDSGTSKVAAFHVLRIPRILFDTQHPECHLFQVLWKSVGTRVQGSEAGSKDATAY